MDVHILGVTKIKVHRTKEHTNSGIWIHLYDKSGQEAWVTVWIDKNKMADFFAAASDELANTPDDEEVNISVEKEEHASSVKA